jgi:hypothetical protein
LILPAYVGQMLDARSPIRRCGTAGAFPVLATALLLGATSCGGDNGANGAVSGEPAVQPIVVTRDKGESRPTCGPREVGQRLRDYARALATVDGDALRGYWGRGFAWFRILLKRGGFEAEDYEEGLAALEARGGVRLRFREVAIDGRGGASFDGAYWREVEERKTRKRIGGKVELSCSRPTIIALAAAGDRASLNTARCPKPDRRVRPKPMIVCTAADR